MVVVLGLRRYYPDSHSHFSKRGCRKSDAPLTRGDQLKHCVVLRSIESKQIARDL